MTVSPSHNISSPKLEDVLSACYGNSDASEDFELNFTLLCQIICLTIIQKSRNTLTGERLHHLPVLYRPEEREAHLAQNRLSHQQ